MQYEMIKTATCKEHNYNTVGKIQGTYDRINDIYVQAARRNDSIAQGWECGECKVEAIVKGTK